MIIHTNEGIETRKGAVAMRGAVEMARCTAPLHKILPGGQKIMEGQGRTCKHFHR